MSVFDLPIEKLSGVGPKTAALFKKMGVDTIGALLEFYPRQYEDWSVCYTTSNAPLGQVCCVKATVAAPVQQYRVRKGMTLYKCNVTDGSTTMRITIFNNRFAVHPLSGCFPASGTSAPSNAAVLNEKRPCIKHGLFVSMVGRARFERATLCLKGRYSTD